MTEKIVLLDQIADNPYQPRIIDNAEHIENLARSIAADGLLQVPTARQMPDGSYQLAFGHSRRKAFEWLNKNWSKLGLPDRYEDGYNNMPLNISDLTDEDMYRQAVSENVQRKDLDPIELAKAMVVYRDQFGKNSDEIGELFGMNGATVRGKLRLLDLPEQVQVKLSSGEISEGAGRLLITLNRMAPEQIEEALQDIADGDNPEQAVDYRLRASKNTKIIREDVFSSRTKTFKHLPEIQTLQEIRDVVDMGWDKYSDSDLADMYKRLSSKNAEARNEDEKKVLHLLKPPACTACPFFATVDGTEYCSFEACYSRKEISNTQAKFLKMSEESGIAVYDEEKDGKYTELVRGNETHMKHLAAQHADLRLVRANKESWRAFLQFAPNMVVAVGELKKKIDKANEQSRKDRNDLSSTSSTNDEATRKKEKNEARIQNIRFNTAKDAIEPFLFKVIAPHFSCLLDSIKQIDFLKSLYAHLDTSNDLHDELAKNKQLSKPAQLNLARQGVVAALLQTIILDGWDDVHKVCSSKHPAKDMAKKARSIAETWGVKLGKDFDTAVEAADNEIEEARRVAIETEE